VKSTSYYPVLMAQDVPRTAAFYIDHLEFKPLFESDWYVHLQSRDDPSVNLGIVLGDHETVPPIARGQVSGLLLNFEVVDPDSVFERFKAAGLPILLALRDEPFGQRHFISADPNGVLIDVIKPIPPSEEFATQYAETALPR
jgi:catechol 2,3-dioxygenase-like lactoylglutathione lyase family enzyme